MTPDEFRKNGRLVIDWIADYMEQVDQHPVRSKVLPGEIRSMLSLHPPPRGEPFEDLLGDVDRILMPGITHWQSPNFFAFFPANNSGPSILGELLSAGLGVQGMLWITSPACTELETHVLDWVVEMLELPASFRSDSKGGGVIQDTASSATLCALLAARGRATGFVTNQRGVGRQLTVYASEEAHSSVDKAVMIAGMGTDCLRKISTRYDHAMDPDALASAIQTDRRAGHIPCFVVATVGTTGSGAIDPLQSIGEICKQHSAWLHVDAAMYGSAAVCPELRFIHHGIELADSYCFNPHKWMFVNFDCDCFYVSDRESLIRSLSVSPEYLRNQASQSGQVIDYRDWQIPLGRRFRALKLWFVIRHFGIEGLRERIRNHVTMAQEFAGWIDAHTQFELATKAHLNLVCFRHVGGGDRNRHILQQLNETGKVYLTHAVIDGKYTLRMSIGQTHTTHEHVARAWELIRRIAE